jgi:hypothetical protein
MSVVLLPLLTVAHDSAIAALENAADSVTVVTLKDGRTIVGKIVKQTAEVVVIENSDGLREIPASFVKSIDRVAAEKKEMPKAIEQVSNGSVRPETVFVETSHPDGRSGFIIGIGLGFGSSTLSRSATSFSFGSNTFTSGGGSNTETGLNGDFKIGHAPTDQVAIYLTGKATSYPSGSSGVSTFVGVGCIGGTYFIKPDAPSLFVSAGIGSSVIQSSSDFSSASSSTRGFGAFVGGGYEFARHWDVELNLMFGSPQSDVSYFGFKVSINVLSW